MSKRLAVIDLGTNTFHLLIVLAHEGRFEILFRERRFVKLAESGIETIGAAPLARGLAAMDFFAEQIKGYQTDQVRAFGTAALRTASNGAAFIQMVKERTGLAIELIDGNREALLIHKGTQQAVPFTEENRLIMDIGGGSVEFIIANQERIFWAKSFPIGVAVLSKEFHHSDPIQAKEQNRLEAFLSQSLAPLKQALALYPCEDLIGASGTFDVLENMLANGRTNPHFAEVNTLKLQSASTLLINSTLDERLQMEKIPSHRADMVVVAMILIEWVTQTARIKRILVSDYAMKEGMLAEMLE